MELNLKKLRTRKGLTQERVANKSGISRTSYREYESYVRSPSVDIASRILSVLGYDIKIIKRRQ